MADFLKQRLQRISAAGTYRELTGQVTGVDFWSNDYLGLAREGAVALPENLPSGASGSRSISGDGAELQALEGRVAVYHGFPAALLFPSGYSANLGLLSALLRRTDTIVYDELIHASCRDGIRLGQGRALRFRHNDAADLRRQLERTRPDGQRFVLTEGRFSMDGDPAPLGELAAVCAEYAAHLIVDEAHSGGLDGPGGRGLVAGLGLTDRVFASVITYGKAFGSHGAAVLGGTHLRDYLVNTCRPFIYSTAPAPAQVHGIATAYSRLERLHPERKRLLDDCVVHFREAVASAGLERFVPPVSGPIQIVQLPGNGEVMRVEAACRSAGLLVKGIRSPTVAAGRERIRICLHAYNTEVEVDRLVNVLVGQLTG